MSAFITRLSIKVQPNAGRNEVVGSSGGIWKIKIGAPPDKGKANKELIEFLSEALGVRKDSISILKGETSHNKILAIIGMNPEEVNTALSALCK
jgi:uncharacterized protein